MLGPKIYIEFEARFNVMFIRVSIVFWMCFYMFPRIIEQCGEESKHNHRKLH